MSKKNKVSSAKKASNKKVVVKKVTKPAKKNSKPAKPAKKVSKIKAKPVSTKKPIAKTKAVKKIAKPVVKKPLKPTKTKKAVSKKPVANKKAQKAVKAAVKPTKKVAPKAKNNKVVVKKTVVTKTLKTAKPNKAKIEVSKKEKTTAAKPLVTKKVETVKVKSEIKSNTDSKKSIADNYDDLDVKPKKNNESKSNDVMAVSNSIPERKQAEISASKIASISSGITNPIKSPESYSVKAEKEPAGKFEIEFVVKASADMLYEFLYTNSGLSEWFCDDVNIRNGIYTFIWDGQMQQARLLKTIDNQLVRFQWVDKSDGSYFEFKIQHDDLTNDNSLIITDFADSNAEIDSAKLLWQNQIDKLMHVIGSIF